MAIAKKNTVNINIPIEKYYSLVKLLPKLYMVRRHLFFLTAPHRPKIPSRKIKADKPIVTSLTTT